MTVLRGIALGLYLLPTLGLPGTQAFGFPLPWIATWFLSALALAIVLIAAAVASRHKVTAGILLAVLALPMGLVQMFLWGGVGLALVLSAVAVALPALSWAVTRPFRGPGYAALGAGAVVLVGAPLLLQFVDGDAVDSFVYPFLTPVVSVGAIVMAIVLERRPASTAKPAVLA